MRGLRLLQAHDIPFHVISVITKLSLGHAEEIYRFFAELGVSQVGFNIEEIEAANVSSSLKSSPMTGIHTFMAKVFDLQKTDGGRMCIREFDAAFGKLQSPKSLRSFDFPYFNEQVRLSVS